MDTIHELVTRPPSPAPILELRDKLDKVYQANLRDQLQSSLERLQRTGSPPRHVSSYALFWRAVLEMNWAKRHPDMDSRSVSVTPTEPTVAPWTPISSDTTLTCPSPNLAGDKAPEFPPPPSVVKRRKVQETIILHTPSHCQDKPRRSLHPKQKSATSRFQVTQSRIMKATKIQMTQSQTTKATKRKQKKLPQNKMRVTTRNGPL